MLNLKKLEKQLDRALAKETSKSLSDWLLKKRKLMQKRDSRAQSGDHRASKC